MPGRRDPEAKQGKRRGRPLVYYVLASEQFPAQELIKYGVEAERAGFAGVWTSDHFQPWQANEGHSAPAWVTLAALTQRTSRIAFGTGVTCPIFRYRPAVIAQVWASLDLLAPERAFLGVGTGEKLNEGAAGGGWGTYEERVSRLVEALTIIRALWTGKHVRIKGRFWDVDAKLYDPPASRIPIYVAAGGPKSARLAGIHGDGMITGASSLKTDPRIKAAWEGAATEAHGGSPTKPIIVEHWAIVGDEGEAREAAKKWRFIPKAWEHGFFDDVSPEQIQARSEKEIELDQVLKDWTVSPEADDHIDAIQKLSELGATHVVVHVPTPNQSKVIDFFGREVLPLLNAA